MNQRKSVITRVYVPTHVRDLPNGERETIPGHYRTPETGQESTDNDGDTHDS
ncbi:hypothetical protein [Modicisalibacter sp. 'Wilcox']|uniref:hypothetical protein n=1 Tax=Modicisalibacter sp. 'Wilcox' TaxID=2679914 RepID=UPI0007917153|nr:hypothetical protein [Modicisalibacter sp. 'Wilcox']KXS37847.1 MAG: hypothetical protein AWU55_1945 [Halomonadaceae bacterium T82-2]